MNVRLILTTGGDDPVRVKDENKQKRIKEAMVSLILRDGIDGTSISKIAKEAGVSAATIYVYYENKEQMLAEVFREYAHQPYQYITECIRPEMSGSELIDTMVRSCYAFSIEHEEIFSFVEQCSRCPSLSAQVCEKDCSGDVLTMIHAYQESGVLKRCSDWNMAAILFAPVRWLATNRSMIYSDSERLLDEQVQMIQEMLLR